MSTPYPPPGPPQYQPQTPTCYRHPDRQTYVQCARCGRFVCPDCMRVAAVGHQCVDCVAQGTASVRQPKRISAGTPVVTYALIAVNVLMFVLQRMSPAVFEWLCLWPAGIMHGEWWRILTSAFLHVDVMHILFNMWALWVVGPPLERWLGRSRFIGLYLLSALGGGVLVYLLSPINVPTIGASGAIFGLFGATFVVGKRLNMDVRGVIAIIVINLAFTFVIPLLSQLKISWQGHIGGLLTGVAVAWLYAYTPRERNNSLHLWASVGLLAVFLALVWWRTTQLVALYG